MTDATGITSQPPHERLLRLELERIVRLLKMVGAEKIILFGSLARGREKIFTSISSR